MKRLLSMAVCMAALISICSFGTHAAGVPAVPDPICTQEEWEMLKLTNKQRLAGGLTPYSIFHAFQSAADIRKKELVELYSHTRPNGLQCFTAITEAGLGYTSAAENIAAGQSSADAVIAAWMDSDAHRLNILDSKFVHVAMGSAAAGFLGTSWVELYLADNCTITSISLSEESVVCLPGSSVDDLDLYMKASCSIHGDCYLPILNEMCSPFYADSPGIQTLTVEYAGHSAPLKIRVASSLPDVSDADAWAVDWIMRADELSLLSQINQSNFTADITRLQFADLVVTLAQQLAGSTISPAAEDSFTDSTDEVILKAKAMGIASGYKVNDCYEFRPNNPITRQEICVMLANAVAYLDTVTPTPAELDRTQTISTSFPDAALVAGWAAKQVALMTNNGIMGGRASNGSFMLAPEDNTTLQEGVTLAVKLYDVLK